MRPFSLDGRNGGAGVCTCPFHERQFHSWVPRGTARPAQLRRRFGDSFHFVYEPVDKDLEAIATVYSIDDTNPYAKAGVMVRQSTAPDAAHVLLGVKPSGEVEFLARRANGGPTEYLGGVMATFPISLSLIRTREGDVSTFTAHVYSAAGAWTTGPIVASITPDCSDEPRCGPARDRQLQQRRRRQEPRRERRLRVVHASLDRPWLDLRRAIPPERGPRRNAAATRRVQGWRV